MKKIYLLLFVFLCMAFEVIADCSYIQSNISINYSSNLIYIRNKHEYHTFNITNESQFLYNITWNETGCTDYLGNVTIINQSLSCNFNTTFSNFSKSLDDINYSIEVVMREIQRINISGQTETYYKLYADCTANLSTCMGYRDTNEGYLGKFTDCTNVKDNFYQQKVKCEANFLALNQSYHLCKTDTQNMGGQRIIFGIIGFGLGYFLCYYILKLGPSKNKIGSLSTDDETTSPIEIDHVNPAVILSKRPPLQKPKKKAEGELGVPDGNINPYDMGDKKW